MFERIDGEKYMRVDRDPRTRPFAKNRNASKAGMPSQRLDSSVSISNASAGGPYSQEVFISDKGLDFHYSLVFISSLASAAAQL